MLYGAWQQIQGYTNSPDQADGRGGERYLEAIVRAVAQALIDCCQLTETATQ